MRATRQVGWWSVRLFMLGTMAGLACDLRPSSPAASRECPACECKCDCQAPAPPTTAPPTTAPPTTAPVEMTPVATGPGVATGPAAADIGELLGTAMRKMNHDDGAGCLADLDRIDAIDPKQGGRQAATRGQCEMLAGKCREGKQRVARWYQEETNMTPERAQITAEALASMRCRGGDSSDRDRLMRALFDLSDGAYMNKRTPQFCKNALAEARRLIPVVKTRGPDDTQISGGAQALFHTAASCFARAGDCDAAWSTYRELFPNASAASTPEAAAMMPQIIRDAYDSSILFCGAEKRGPAKPEPPPPPPLPPKR